MMANYTNEYEFLSLFLNSNLHNATKHSNNQTSKHPNIQTIKHLNLIINASFRQNTKRLA